MEPDLEEVVRFERGLGRDGMERVEREDDDLGKMPFCVSSD